MKIDQQPWWLTDNYDQDIMVPSAFTKAAGPHGVALVKAYSDGRTQAGWGLIGPKDQDGEPSDGFVVRYQKKQFDQRKAAFAYRKIGQPFAFIMRSMRIICIDIDGKNDGFIGAKKLGNLPATLAETSKSGNGYHLFYTTDEDWNLDEGFGQFADHVGLEQGVDIRSIGCVYHHTTQRWNTRAIAPLPNWLAEILRDRKTRRTGDLVRITKVKREGDEFEMLMMQTELVDELNKPIKSGSRNNTLFAIAMKMKAAGVPDWEDLVMDRGTQVGLDLTEIARLVANVQRAA